MDTIKNDDHKTHKDEDGENISRRIVQGLIIAGVFSALSIVIVVAIYFYRFPEGLPHEYTAWGTFGDFVGGVLNPLFSFLALIAILVTVYFQRLDLKISRDELKQSTKALQEQSR